MNDGPPDAPVPATEPREQLAFELDLPTGPRCEEAFDLALYRDRAIELVTWDRAAHGCTGRTVQVRFLRARIDRERVIEAMRSAGALAVRPAAPRAVETSSESSDGGTR